MKTTAPIKHTCPEIDRYIKFIKQAIYKDSQLRSLNESELFKVASDMSTELEACIDYLESMRESNKILRDWGEELYEKVDELEEEIKALNETK